MKQIYSVKAVKLVHGHDGKILQCSVYKDGKRIGVYAEDSWGGPAMLLEMTKKDEEDLIEFSKKFEDSDYGESYNIMLSELGDQFLFDKKLKAVCRKKIAFIDTEQKQGNYWSMPGKLTSSVRRSLETKHDIKLFYNDVYNLGVA